MNEDLSASFANLLDPDYQGHVIAAMDRWCDDYRYASGEAYADLILSDISHPLWAWIDETKQKRKPGNYRDIELSTAFAEKADEIVFILLHKTRPLYPEHVAMLNDAWAQFQRSIAYHLHIENSVFIAELPAAVAAEIQRRIDEEERQREIKRKDGLIKFINAGRESSIKYDDSIKKQWVGLAKQILRKERDIPSIRKLSVLIEEKGRYPVGANETIRKDKNIIKILNKHKVRMDIG